MSNSVIRRKDTHPDYSEANRHYRIVRAMMLLRGHGVDSKRDVIMRRLAARDKATKEALTSEELAAREYTYRWTIALVSKVFPPPHTLGF